MKKTRLRLVATIFLIGIAISTSFAQVSYNCYTVPVNSSETILIENGKLYRLTIKSSWFSVFARTGTYLIYGLNLGDANFNVDQPSVLITAETPDIDWTFSYALNGQHDADMTITSDGWGDQGLWIGVEELSCPSPTAIGETHVRNESYELSQNYPNPFNPSTTIEYSVQIANNIQIKIYNPLGQLIKTVVDEIKAPGEYSVVWNGKDDNGSLVSSGTYFYQIQTKDFASSKKMILLK